MRLTKTEKEILVEARRIRKRFNSRPKRLNEWSDKAKISEIHAALNRLKRWEPSMSKSEYQLIWDVQRDLEHRFSVGGGYDRDLKQLQGIAGRLLRIDDLSPSEEEELLSIQKGLWTGIA